MTDTLSLPPPPQNGWTAHRSTNHRVSDRYTPPMLQATQPARSKKTKSCLFRIVTGFLVVIELFLLILLVRLCGVV